MKYPRSQWEAQREAIVGLYSRPDLSLTEIVTIMADEHDFYATEAMYKKHLCRWGAFKNVVAHHRDELVQIALAYFDAGLDLPEEDEEGRSIPWDRVKRSCLRNGQHVQMWRDLNIPQRKRVGSNSHPKRVRSAPRRQKNGQRRSEDADVVVYNVVRALLRCRPTPINKEPRSLTHDIDCILSYIPLFQEWRVSVVRQADSSRPAAAWSPNQRLLGDVDREDAAMNILNDYVDLIRSVHQGCHSDARAHFNSARRHFDRYLQQPSLFALYAVLMVHVCTSPEDRPVHAWKTRLMTCFYTSSSAELGPNNPLTRLLRQILSDTTTSSMAWKVAILACMVDAATADFDHQPEAAKWTSLTIRHGLAITLFARDHPASAILCLQDTIRACDAALHHPVLRTAPWSRLHLAEIYQTQGMYDEARAVLEAISTHTSTSTTFHQHDQYDQHDHQDHHHEAKQPQIPGGRLLCCFTLFGSPQNPLLPTTGDKYMLFQRVYESSCRVYVPDAPLASVYTELCRGLLRGIGGIVDHNGGGEEEDDYDDEGEEQGDLVKTIRAVAHSRLRESPRRFITFASAGMV